MDKLWHGLKEVLSFTLYVLAIVLFFSDRVGEATFLMATAIYIEH